MSDAAREGVHQVTAGENPWVEVLEGFEIRVLRVAEDNSRYTMMTRFQPGFELMKHLHDGEVHAYTLSGRWCYLEYDDVFEAGSYVFEEKGTAHTLKIPDDNSEPTVVLFVVDRGQTMLYPDGEVMSHEDGRSIEAYYRSFCSDAGLAVDRILR